jgi:transposase
VRHRAKLVAIRSGLKAQVHAVLAKEGVAVGAPRGLFSLAGRVMLADLALGDAYRMRVDSLVGLIDELDGEVARFDTIVADVLKTHPGYQAIQAIPGVGPILAAVFLAEIGEVDRFASANHLCSWAGLTPGHRESDTTIHRGHITKQGSRLIRWAAVEAVNCQKGETVISQHNHRVAERRGRSIGRVAAARKLLTLVYYGLRDGHIRCLAETG